MTTASPPSRPQLEPAVRRRPRWRVHGPLHVTGIAFGLALAAAAALGTRGPADDPPSPPAVAAPQAPYAPQATAEIVVLNEDDPGDLAILGDDLHYVDQSELGVPDGRIKVAHLDRREQLGRTHDDELEMPGVTAGSGLLCWWGERELFCRDDPSLEWSLGLPNLHRDGGITDVQVRPDAVYWMTFGGNPDFDRPHGELWMARRPDLEPRRLLGGLSGNFYLAVTDGTAYFTTCRDGAAEDCAIESLDLATGARSVLEQTRGDTSEIVADAHELFWIDRGAGEIRGMSTRGGEPWVVAEDQADPRALALDGTRVFWVNAEPGTVNVAGRRGGSVTVVANDQAFPLAVALDDAFVYWSNLHDGTIRRAPKPPPR
jgi:hypothetical protein